LQKRPTNLKLVVYNRNERVVAKGFLYVSYCHLTLVVNPMRFLLRLVQIWKIVAIISRFCATPSCGWGVLIRVSFCEIHVCWCQHRRIGHRFFWGELSTNIFIGLFCKRDLQIKILIRISFCEIHVCFFSMENTANPTWGDIFESSFKAQSSKVSFHWNVAKETLELWALGFRKWHPKWDWLCLGQTQQIYLRWK